MDAAKKKRRPFTRSVAEAACQAWRDLRTARRANIGIWVLYWTFAAAEILLIILMGFQRHPFSDGLQGSQFYSDCLPDGSFKWGKGNFNWWTMPGFFDITISFGNFDFDKVKLIDVVWQLVVGRGGQALLALISWRVFADYIAARITSVPTTYTTFWVIFLHREPTVMSAYRLAREFCLHAAIGSPTAGVFVVGTIVFTLAFPTLVNSMTGYVPKSAPFIRVRDESMTPYERFSRVAYVIHDGNRINLTDDYIVYNKHRGFEVDEKGHRILQCEDLPEAPENCLVLAAISNYVAEYGFYGLLDEKTAWMRDRNFNISDYVPFIHPEIDQKDLPAPALNISSFYISPYTLYGYDWVDPRTQTHPFQDTDQELWAYSDYSDGLYNYKYLEDEGRCQPQIPEKYQWGLSFIQLFIMLVLLLIWSTGLLVLWQKAQYRLDLKDEPEVPQGWRAVFEISKAMEQDLGPAGIDVSRMTDRQAKKEIRKRLQGGSVSLDSHLARPELGGWPAFWAWVRRERWWLPAFASIWCLYFIAVFPISIRVVLWYVSGGILAVIRLGSTVGSRAVMLVVLGLVSGGIVVAVLSRYYPELPYASYSPYI